MEELQDIVEQIDFAMSLVQIGGVPPLLAIVLTPNLPGELRAEVLSVLATVAQNNPYAQDALLACRALPMAVALLLDAPPENGEEGGGEGTTTTTTTTTTPPALRVKALHFLSCLSRGHPPAEEAFFRGAPSWPLTAEQPPPQLPPPPPPLPQRKKEGVRPAAAAARVVFLRRSQRRDGCGGEAGQ